MVINAFEFILKAGIGFLKNEGAKYKIQNAEAEGERRKSGYINKVNF